MSTSRIDRLVVILTPRASRSLRVMAWKRCGTPSELAQCLLEAALSAYAKRYADSLCLSLSDWWEQAEKEYVRAASGGLRGVDAATDGGSTPPEGAIGK